MGNDGENEGRSVEEVDDEDDAEELLTEEDLAKLNPI